jgi:pimeloyl-ACP methyl ester carboxylesterase
MNRARVILAMTLFPSVLFIALYAYYKTRDWMRPDSALFRAEDGVEVRGLREGTGSRIVLILPDPALDRSFNSKSVESTTGAVLAQALAARGFTVIRYDQRGTGRTPGDPRGTGVQRLAEDAILSVRGVPAKDLSVLAHGDSCATAALAHKKGLRAKQWIFVSCGYSGTLLNNWAERLFHNMENSGLPASVRSQARAEWNAFAKSMPELLNRKETPPVPSAKEGESPDLQVIRGAYRELLVERRAWAVDAMAINVKKQILEIVKESRVLFFSPEFDLVTPPLEREAMLQALQGTKARTIQLPGAEFFLLATDGPQVTTMERIVFLKNPLTRPRAEAVKVIADSVE